MEEQGGLGVRRLRLGLGDRVHPDLPQAAQQLARAPPGRRCPPRRGGPPSPRPRRPAPRSARAGCASGRRGRRGRPGARRQQSAALAQQVDRRAGDAVRVHPSEAVADPRVGGKEGRDVAEVGRALQGCRRPLPRRPAPGPPPAARRAGASARGRSPAGGPSCAAARAGPAAPRPRRRRRRAAGQASARSRAAPPAVATVRKRPSKVVTVAPRIAPSCAELPLEGDRRHRRSGRPAPDRGPGRRAGRAGSVRRGRSWVVRGSDRGSSADVPA